MVNKWTLLVYINKKNQSDISTTAVDTYMNYQKDFANLVSDNYVFIIPNGASIEGGSRLYKKSRSRVKKNRKTRRQRRTRRSHRK
jgi:hypothetical protein